MANQAKIAFMRFCDQQGVIYDDADERKVYLRYSGKNISTITVYVFFNEDCSGANVYSWSIGNMKTDDKYAKAMMLCNEMNRKWRWVKFSIDEEKDILVEGDVEFDISNAGKACHSLVERVVDRVDDTYPDFMRLLYS